MQKICCFGNGRNFFNKGWLLSLLLIFLGLTTHANPPDMDKDAYEDNNTKETAFLLSTPFTRNESTVDISSANCHVADDVDYYKIELEAGYSYTFSANLYHYPHYPQYVQMRYSTNNGVAWSYSGNQASSVMGQGGTLYLEISPDMQRRAGAYAVKIELRKVATAGCVYTLSATGKEATAEAASNQEVIVATGDACFWTAFSNANWITLTAGQTATGRGRVQYSYSKNKAMSSRTGTITIAGQTYTVTQTPRRLPPDGYEPNNTKESATLLSAAFTQNESAVAISSANCHEVDDVDYYKIELEAGYSYILSTGLYGANPTDEVYTLAAVMSYSTDTESTWSSPNSARWSGATVQGGTLYLKIKSVNNSGVGTYALTINLRKSTTPQCTYTLSATRKEATAEAASNQEVVVTAGDACFWPAFSDADWITLTAGQSGRGTGSVSYSHKANMATEQREGRIIIAGQTYTVTQAGRPLAPDSYEPNNTVETARLLVPDLAQNAIIISPASCHEKNDVDIYKIEAPLGSPYILNADLHSVSDPKDGNYTLNAEMTYSTNGSSWIAQPVPGRFRNILLPAGSRAYIRIKPSPFGRLVGTYGAKIELLRAAAAGCTYTLSDIIRTVGWEKGANQVEVTTAGSSCAWVAVFDDDRFSGNDWIKLTGGQSVTGSGSVRYSYTENRELYSRIGTIIIAGKVYTVAQTPRPRPLDRYEPNNVAPQAHLFTPEFTQNASTIDISPADIHDLDDVDYYKIVLPPDYFYVLSAKLYDRDARRKYTLEAEPSYSADGSTWRPWNDNKRLLIETMPGGTLYLKIESNYRRGIGTYAVQIDLRRAPAVACSYTLPASGKALTADEGANQVEVTTGASCAWSAFSETSWITLTAGQSAEGSGRVRYSYKANIATNQREGRIIIAGQSYTVTQAGRPLAPDRHEPNNTVNEAASLIPIFTENASVIDISPANVHVPDDVDIYKIELLTGYSYTFNAELYPAYTRNNEYDILNAKISYSTDNGVTWREGKNNRLSSAMMQGGTLYLKIEPQYIHSTNVGVYVAKINLLKSATAGCTYTLSSMSKEVSEEAGDGQVEVTTEGSSCFWSAYSHANWITLTAGQSQTAAGSGSVSYSYKANMAMRERTGAITIANKTYALIQEGRPLFPDEYEQSNGHRQNNTVAEAYSFTPTFAQQATVIDISPANLHEVGDVDIYKINLPSGYSYLFSVNLYDGEEQKNDSNYTLFNSQVSYSTDNGLTWGFPTQLFSYPQESDNGVIWKWFLGRFPNLTLTLAPEGSLYIKIASYYRNSAGSYAAKIDITTTCIYEFSSKSQKAPSAAGIGQVRVMTAAACAWEAASNASWITITQGQGRTVGTNDLRFSYEANLSGVSRTGTIIVARETVIVTQEGAPCSYTLSPTSMSVLRHQGGGKVSVSATPNDCLWKAVSKDVWITIPEDQNLVGSMDLNFLYEDNPSDASREGTIAIAGQTFTVKQSSFTTGFETVSPVKIFPNPAKDFVTIEGLSSNQEWVSLKITNVFGQALYERANPEHKIQIPVTGFSSGVYFIVLQGKEKAVAQKLIIE